MGNPAAIEDDVLDARLPGTLGDRLADGGGALRCRRRLERFTQVGIRRRGGRQRPSRGVVDDLGVDVMQASKHRQPWPFRPTFEMGPQSHVAPDSAGAAIGQLVHYFAAPAPVFPVLPALRRMRSPRYRMPLPL